MISLFVIYGVNSVYSQHAYRNIIYKAFINGDMNKWYAVIYTIEKNAEYKSIDRKIELISYYYGYISYLLRIKNYDLAEKLILKAEILIDEVLQIDKNNPTCLSFKGSFIGFKIAFNKLKAIKLGSMSTSYIDNALNLDKNNVQAIVDRGNVYLHTPTLFGGDKYIAILNFKRAIELMENFRKIENNWFYISTLMQLAKAYEKIDKPLLALDVYKKILKIEPEYRLVRTRISTNQQKLN